MISAEVVRKIDIHTVMVSVLNVKRHELCGKVLRNKKNFLCQVDDIDLKCGDKVYIKDSRPFSKKKKHVVVKLVG